MVGCLHISCQLDSQSLKDHFSAVSFCTLHHSHSFSPQLYSLTCLLLHHFHRPLHPYEPATSTPRAGRSISLTISQSPPRWVSAIAYHERMYSTDSVSGDLTRTSRSAFLVFAFCITQNVVAVVFEQCFKEIRANMTGQAGGVDSDGHPVANITEAVGITYHQCVQWCSSAPETFAFATFSRTFTAWLLPWLALISQLPFNGSNNKIDDVVSVCLAVGSPTLAGYSLALTAYNKRWLAQRIEEVEQPPREVLQTIERVLNWFQTMHLDINETHLADVARSHASVRLSGQQSDPLRNGDCWWKNVEHELEYAPQGQVSAATALAWVFVAYIFTVIDSFSSLQDVQDTYGLGPGVATDGISDGQGVGSIWLWLLPIVVGWLVIEPKYQYKLNLEAFKRGNEQCYGMEGGEYAIKIFQGPVGRQLYTDRHRSAPIFNYARLTSWAQDVDKVLDIYKDAFTQHPLVTSNHSNAPQVEQPSTSPKGNKDASWTWLPYLLLLFRWEWQCNFNKPCTQGTSNAFFK
jgi:hypothetical protein